MKRIHKSDCKLMTSLLSCKRKIPPLNILESQDILSKILEQRSHLDQNLARTLNLPIYVLEIFYAHRNHFQEQIQAIKCTCTEESTSLTSSCGSITVTSKKISQISCSNDEEASKLCPLVARVSMSNNHRTIEENNSNPEQEDDHDIIATQEKIEISNHPDNDVLFDGWDAVNNSGTFLESDISTAQGLHAVVQIEETSGDGWISIHLIH